MLAAALLGVLLLMAPMEEALACSYVEVPIGQTKNTVIARTMELGFGYEKWQVVLHPRDTQGRSLYGPGYGFVSLDGMLKLPGLDEFKFPTDGLNEHGLSISANVLNLSEYEPSAEDNRTISFLKVVTLVLRNATTVNEALSVLGRVRVTNDPPEVAKTLSLHWTIADANGDSVIVEYLKGKLTHQANTVGIMTNDPPFDWQLYNLNNYVNLQMGWPSENNRRIQIDTESAGSVPRVVGHGFNTKGLPGDSSPPSRFVRLFYLRQYARVQEPVVTVEDAIALCQGLMNNVFIIKGTVSRSTSLLGYEYVPWTVLKIPSQNLLIFRTYTDQQWRSINLTRVDFNRSHESVLSLPTGLNIKDVTQEL